MIDRTISRYFDEVWNEGHVDALDDLLTADYINHSSSVPNTPPGPEGLKPIVLAMRAAIPDLHYTILDLVIGDSKAAVYLQGTRWVADEYKPRLHRRRVAARGDLPDLALAGLDGVVLDPAAVVLCAIGLVNGGWQRRRVARRFPLQ